MASMDSTSTPATLLGIKTNVSNAKKILETLESHFGSLDKTSTQADKDWTKSIESLRKDLKNQGDASEGAMKEVNSPLCSSLSEHYWSFTLFTEVLEELYAEGFVKNMRQQVTKEVNQQIDPLVQQEVAKQLDNYMAEEHQQKLVELREQIDTVNIGIQNTESRRANSLLNKGNPGVVLSPIYDSKGKIGSSLISAHVNMFGGSPLNRLSWLRSSHTFFNTIIAFPSTRWLLFNAGKPLTIPDDTKATKQAIAFLRTEDLKSILGSEPYFGQGKEKGEILEESTDASGFSPLEAVRHHDKPVVFLGVLEPDTQSVPLQQDVIKDPQIVLSKLGGTPYFSMEISDLELSPEELDQVLKNTQIGQQGVEFSWAEPRGLSLALDLVTAGIFALARSMTDWNSRNKFCPGCGCKTYSMWGGWKISCTSLLPWTDNNGRKPCPTIKGLHNFTHPRTDGVVIMVTIDETGDKKRFPGRFYSALAGFIEPGETFEDAVKREMWEEAGIDVWDVRYHSGQPWPYPAHLMVGFYARANSEQPIRTDLDNELVDARWFTRQEIQLILSGKGGQLLSQADYKKLTDRHEGDQGGILKVTTQAVASAENPTLAELATAQAPDDPIKLPPTTAIAGVLIKHWADGKIGFPNDTHKSTALQQGNL
ncbi:hypothetical protein AMATHDRAFT_2420 [Amanita thiersii Skay4041]|uniref:NAD(+) diphosphatase n=1 Tax=Amanita thiersii Skay4041 TaxID=703135 RepID=A0A2A9NWH3_9AGAR|nr:hypothetical protein AMATHDRAFT_2420 [Amanita thiersii Skay4041]